MQMCCIDRPMALRCLTMPRRGTRSELGVDQAAIEDWIAKRKEAVSDDIREPA